MLDSKSMLAVVPPLPDPAGAVAPARLIHGNVRTLKPPTEAQLRVLRFIHGYHVYNGYSPAIRDIGRAMGILSTNGVADHLRRLEDRGLLVRGGAGNILARTLRVTVEGLVALGHEVDPDAPPHAVSSSQYLDLIAARKEATRLRSLLHRVMCTTMTDLPRVIVDIRRELGE